MVLKLEGFGYDNEEFYKFSLEIRQQVLVLEFGFDKHLEFDGRDFKAMHYILFFNSQAVGCARWTEKDHIISIDRFCILKDFRNRGFGHLLIKFIIEDVLPSKKKLNLLTISQNSSFFQIYRFKQSGKFEKMGDTMYEVLNF